MANLLFSVKLTVSGLEVPHVETFQTSTEVTAGSQMELVCAVSGKPQPTVYWTKGTDRIEPNKGTGLPGLVYILERPGSSEGRPGNPERHQFDYLQRRLIRFG